MRICVYGAGAIGGFIAVMLKRQGHDVSVVARGPHLAAIRSKGLSLIFEGETHTVRLPAEQDPHLLGPQDYVIVTAKAPSLPEIATGLGPLIGPATAIVTAMNGIPWWFFHGFAGFGGTKLTSVDPGGLLAEAIPPDRVIGCVLHIACDVPEPGVIRHNNQNRFIVGEPDGSESARARDLVDAMSEAGMGAELSGGIQQQYWIKLLGNMAYAPVSVLTDATNDQIAEDPRVRSLCVRMIDEAAKVGRHYGLEPGMTSDERVDLGGSLIGFRTSMLQDFDRGRPVELDTIVRSVMEMGDMADIETPLIDAIFALAAQKCALAGLYHPPTEAA